LTVDVGDGVKEMGREEGGGEVPVIDEGVGGNTAGTDRGYSTIFKFNRTKWGKLKESNVVKFDRKMGAISALYLGGKWGR
jgi:hypothetical protein